MLKIAETYTILKFYLRKEKKKYFPMRKEKKIISVEFKIIYIIFSKNIRCCFLILILISETFFEIKNQIFN